MSNLPQSEAGRLAAQVRDMTIEQLQKVIAACTAEIRRQDPRPPYLNGTSERVGG